MAWLLLVVPAFWLLLLAWFARPLRAAWREPALRQPVLIVESDDWGPGPARHAQALGAVMDCLLAHRDGAGRAPVMTLGLVLSLPDGAAIAAAGYARYHQRDLADPAYAGILAVLRAGIAAGVFAPQLHGMAHYWPDTLLRAAASDAEVRQWLAAGPGLETEALPSPLQSRWTDASVLPSRPLPAAAIQAAVAEEVACYRALFGTTPEVAVPPTFIWDATVEAAWAAQGVACVITPGRRCAGRDAQGRPACGAEALANGQRGAGGLVYLVRDRYFEPARGHQAEQGLAALAEKTAQGRPCLLETHRFNFTGAEQASSLAQLDRLLTLARARFPGLRFASSAELARQYRDGGDWLATGLGVRLAAWAARVESLPRFARLARLSGLGLVLAALRGGGAAGAA